MQYTHPYRADQLVTFTNRKPFFGCDTVWLNEGGKMPDGLSLDDKRRKCYTFNGHRRYLFILSDIVPLWVLAYRYLIVIPTDDKKNYGFAAHHSTAQLCACLELLEATLYLFYGYNKKAHLGESQRGRGKRYFAYISNGSERIVCVILEC